jgi:hypothetical protein
MIVVSDTTPLNYLILIEAAQVLPALFGRVYPPGGSALRGFFDRTRKRGNSTF